MMRTLLAGSFYALAGAATLLLAASIFYSCRTGGNPHHSGSAAARSAPTETTSSLSQDHVEAERVVIAESHQPPA